MEQRTVRLDDVSILVLDEADRMLDMGFAPQINRILTAVPKKRQTMLFSATMQADIVKIATTHMELPVRVEVAQQGTGRRARQPGTFMFLSTQRRSYWRSCSKNTRAPFGVLAHQTRRKKKIAQSVQ